MARVLIHFSDKSSAVHFRRGIWNLKRAIVTGILSIGLAPCLVNVCGSAVAIAINRQLADHGGDLAIGAFGIINRILILFAMLVIGLTQGMQPIIGYNHGAMKPDPGVAHAEIRDHYGHGVHYGGLPGLHVFFPRHCRPLYG